MSDAQLATLIVQRRAEGQECPSALAETLRSRLTDYAEALGVRESALRRWAQREVERPRLAPDPKTEEQ